MRRSLTLEVGAFGRSALRDETRRLDLSVEEFVAGAARYFLAEDDAERPARRLPDANVRAQAEAVDVDLDLEMGTWRALDAECRRQGVTREELLVHAVLFLIADLESGRVSHRLVGRSAGRASSDR